jgi:EmrB/QacA subfamily drug resistance transporter
LPTAAQPPCDESQSFDAQPSGGKAAPESSKSGTLVATVLGSSLAFVVGAIINIALPSMQRDFGTDAAGVQWIVNAYLLPLAALVLVGGALGDHFGRKRYFMIGLVVFLVATLGCALAPNLEVLLAARFLQGVGAALIAPNSLAILADAFSGEERGKAIGTWAAAGAVAGAAAPLIGGLVVDLFDWRWAFAIVIPPSVAAWVIGQRAIRESMEDGENRAPLDITGAVLATLALALVVYALISFPQVGWQDPTVLVTGGFGLLCSGLFIWVQHSKQQGAMMPLGVFASGSFSGISILTLLLYGALGGLLVLLPYMLINSLNYSATAAGAALLPFPLILSTLSRSAGGWAVRIGIRNTLTLGPLLVAVGFVLFAALARPDMSYWTGILPGLLVMALGMAISVAPLTTAVMNAVERDYVGVAAGVNNAISRTAGLIATAFLGLVLVGADSGSGAGEAASNQLITGFSTAAWVGAILATASAFASFTMIREEAVKG